MWPRKAEKERVLCPLKTGSFSTLAGGIRKRASRTSVSRVPCNSPEFQILYNGLAHRYSGIDDELGELCTRYILAARRATQLQQEI